MKEDLERVKDQLDELEETLHKMKNHPSSDDKDVSDPKQDENEPSEPSEDTEQTKEPETSNDTHPSTLTRFREKLDHGHEAIEQGHTKEAQTIYRSLIQDYRSLKERDELTEDDEERLHALYDKVDIAKE